MSEQRQQSSKDLRKLHPLVKTLSISNYKVDQKVINRALWNQDEPPASLVSPRLPDPLPEKK